MRWRPYSCASRMYIVAHNKHHSTVSRYHFPRLKASTRGPRALKQRATTEAWGAASDENDGVYKFLPFPFEVRITGLELNDKGRAKHGVVAEVDKNLEHVGLVVALLKLGCPVPLQVLTKTCAKLLRRCLVLGSQSKLRRGRKRC